jgi:hypothetical protein
MLDENKYEGVCRGVRKKWENRVEGLSKHQKMKYSQFSYWLADGKTSFFRGCYGSLISGSGDGELDPIEKLTVFHPFHETFKRKLVDFVISDDFFGPAFLTKDSEEGLYNGFKINTEIPAYYVLGAIIALRKTFLWVGPKENEVSFVWEKYPPLEALYLLDQFEFGLEDFWRSSYSRDHNIWNNRIFSLGGNEKPRLNNAFYPLSKENDIYEGFWYYCWGPSKKKVEGGVGKPINRKNLEEAMQLILERKI